MCVCVGACASEGGAHVCTFERVNERVYVCVCKCASVSTRARVCKYVCEYVCVFELALYSKPLKTASPLPSFAFLRIQYSQ